MMVSIGVPGANSFPQMRCQWTERSDQSMDCGEGMVCEGGILRDLRNVKKSNTS